MQIKKYRKPLISFFSITAVLACALVVQSNYTPAYAVKMNGEEIGIVADAAVYEQAANSVEEQAAEILGEEYKLEGSTNLEPTVTPKARLSTVDQVEASLLSKVDEIEQRYVLTVDGTVIGAMKSENTLQELLDRIAAPYRSENTTKYEFVENVFISYTYTAADITDSPELIYNKLSANTQEEATYIVSKGDTYSEIANDNGMTLDELMALNPQANLNKLMIGDILTIKKAVPFLSIKTIENKTYEEVIDSPIQYVDDPSLYIGNSKTTTEGTAGIAKINADFTYINGNETEREVKSSVTIKEPTTTIVAKGTTPRPKTASYGTYIWPVKGTVTSTAGSRTIFGSTSYHEGLDIAAPYGTNVKASDGGLVTFAGWQGDYGNLVIITHDNGTQTYYAHNSSLIVSKGERVYQGQAIAKVGSTGRSTGNHSHFEVRINGSIRNPYNYL